MLNYSRSNKLSHENIVFPKSAQKQSKNALKT